MLGKTKREQILPDPVPKPVSSAPEAKTIIGENISIEGSIRGKGDLVIEGLVKGSIELETYHLTVGSKGQVEAEIRAGNVTVSGRVTGSVEAQDKVAITRNADFNGEIKAKRISVEDGAMLKAVIELQREPQIKAVPKDRPADPPTAAVEKETVAVAGDREK